MVFLRGRLRFAALVLGLLLGCTLFAQTRVSKPMRITVAPAPHSVHLTWVGSTSPNITEQRMYRTTTKGIGYTLVGTVNSATFTFDDKNVVSGVTYYYVVTAYAPSGYSVPESLYSNEATAIVP